MYIEAVTPNMTVFGDRAVMEVIRVKLGHKRAAMIYDRISLLVRRQPRELALTLFLFFEDSKKVVIFKLGRELSTGSAVILILEFPASRTVGNKYLLFKPPSL